MKYVSEHSRPPTTRSEPMIVARTIAELRIHRRALPGTIGFVPTMGALHDGHTSLMQAVLESADHLVVSIFVNPTQFDRASDLESYPRDEEDDLRGCEAAGAEIVFIPPPQEMYPNGRDQRTKVFVDELTATMCGRTRPGHFDGVAMVVSKLFNIVEPDVAAFGQKDYQQLAVIQQMTNDLNFAVQILGVETGRNPDGLAISSRNRLLTPDGRRRARALSRGLIAAHSAFAAGERSGPVLQRIAAGAIVAASLRVDYAECVHPATLQLLDEIGDDGAVLAVAAFDEDVRLIDNVRLDRTLPEALLKPDRPDDI